MGKTARAVGRQAEPFRASVMNKSNAKTGPLAVGRWLRVDRWTG